MKHMKKLFGLLLAVVMVFAMSVSVFADAKVTVEGDSKGILTNHTFKAYQIVKGTVAENVLTDPFWGDGVDTNNFLAELQKEDTFSNCSRVEDFVKILSDNNTDSALAEKVAKIAYKNKRGDGSDISTTASASLETGYYLIVDTTKNLAEGSAYNAALLRVVGDVTIAVKTDAPEVEKKVKENTKYNQNDTSTQGYSYGEGYNDVADYNIGDRVPFSFYSKVPDMSKYDTYKYVFHDTMSEGLTLDKSTIKVTIGTTELTAGQYNVKTTSLDEGCTFEVEITNLKAIPQATVGTEIRVDFGAVLNENAKIGLPGNPNEVHLEYSSNPNETKKTNNTPVDRVIVFTYELDTTKIDGATASNENPTKLPGAEFKLRVNNGKWVQVDSATHRVTGWTDDENAASVLVSDKNGIFKVIGLDAGKYQLKETKAPENYNLLKDLITVEITAATTNGQGWDTAKDPADALMNISVTADGKNGTGNVDTGTANITIANNKGGSLPSTGGIGTTIFYVVGGILMAVAAILLITKKKMSNK